MLASRAQQAKHVMIVQAKSKYIQLCILTAFDSVILYVFCLCVWVSVWVREGERERVNKVYTLGLIGEICHFCMHICVYVSMHRVHTLR